MSDNLVKDFNEFLYNSRKEAVNEGYGKFSYPEMVEWWIKMLVLIRDAEVLPNGEKTTEEDREKARESIQRLEFEINLYVIVNEGQD
ncbi:hypothetical protein [Priestia megaterium]|uniref:hypothetical protein n=1 Tax=Priestia megaterium TaxID=1404 RepID=UPI00285D9D2A|nr:hypothetical protein [Priestia megaterium]MDR7207651.1 hypothetical protein [Priestia megaterium]